jgi:hypothetical protein
VIGTMENPSQFPGFRLEALQFFKDLSQNNNHAWFAEHETDFETLVRLPMRMLVEELRPFLLELDPTLRARKDPNEHFSRIDWGAQAPPDTPPYKISFYTFFWNTRMPRLHDAWLYVGINADAVTLGFSVYDAGRLGRGRLKELFLPRVESDLELLDNYLKATYLRRGFDFHRYERAPGRLGLREVDPFPNKPEDWLGTLGWVVSRAIGPASGRLTAGSFMTECHDTFRRLHPLYVFASDPETTWRDRVQAPS